VLRAQQENHAWKDDLNPKIAQQIPKDPDYAVLEKYYKWNI
jgi:hypothetical protein